MDMKRYFLYFITIAALTSAGCGGGGGTSLMVGDERATQDLIDALAARADITPVMVQELRDQIAMLEGRADITPVMVQELRDQLATLEGRADITPVMVQELRDQIAMLEGRADITPVMVQELRDEIARLMALPDMTPADVQALRDQIALLMMRATPEEVQELRDQIATLSAMEPADVQALRDQIATLMMRATPAEVQALRDQIATLEGRADITPAMVQALRDQIATLEGRADITPAMVQDLRDQIATLSAGEPADVQALRDQIATLEGRADITPAMVQALRDQIAMLEGRADITPAALQILRADIARLTLQVEAGDTRMEDPRAKKIAPAIADPDGDGVLGENNATARGTVADSATTVAATADDLENPNRPGKGVDNDGSTDDFAVMPGGIGVMEEISIGLGDARDRLGMMDGTVDDENEFDIMADGTVDGFARNVHTRTNTADQSDTVTVFDNRDDPGDVPYREYYNDAQTDSDGDVVFDDEAILTTDPYDRDAVTEISEEGVLTIDTGATGDIAGNGKLFSATDFPSGDRVRYEYPADDVATEDVDESEARTFAGRFNGIPGEYSCTGTECSARNGMDGYLDLLIGAWEFTPDRVAKDADPHKIADAKFDADYLAFGYWLQGTGEGDKVKYGIGTFASGSMQFGGATPATPVALLVGTATYSGPAGGMFVMKTDINDDNMGPVPTQAGKFLAEAELTAKFGSTTATADDFTISGTVTDFVLSNHDGSTVKNDWSLPLNRATFADRTYNTATGVINPESFDNHASTFGGTTGAGDNLGRWEGGFYGPVVTEDNDTAVLEAQTGYPTGVAGEFIGHFETGHVIGAFGAPIDQ